MYCSLGQPMSQPHCLDCTLEQTKIITDPVMGIKGFEFEDSGAVVEYGIDRVVYAQSASWAGGVNALYGVGGVQPLQREIRCGYKRSEAGQRQCKEGST